MEGQKPWTGQTPRVIRRLTRTFDMCYSASTTQFYHKYIYYYKRAKTAEL